MYIRALAAGTLIVFLTTQSGFAQALPDTETAARPEFIFRKNFSIPKNLGTIERLKKPAAGAPFYLLIQDAHAVIDSQIKIHHLIQYLAKHQYIRLVGVEGGTGPMDTLLLKTFPDPFIKAKVMRRYLERGELSGTGAASIFDKEPVRYEGIENWTLYAKHIASYREAMKQKDAWVEKFQEERKRVDEKRRHNYPADVSALHEKIEMFYQEKISFYDFLRFLSSWGREHQAGPAENSELEKLLRSIEPETPAEKEKPEVTLKRMAQSFKLRKLVSLKPEDQALFNKNFQAFSNAQIDAGTFLDTFLIASHKAGLRLKLTPALRSLAERSRTLSAIHGTKVFKELENFIQSLLDRFLTEPNQKEIAAAYQKIRLMETLVKLELTKEQWKEIKASPIDKSLRPFLAFYELAEERDQVLHAKMQSLLKKQKAQAGVVVVGGFHTEGLEAQFEKEGAGYAVIMPRIRSLEGKDQYANLMAGNFSYKNFLKDSFFEAFMRHAVAQLASEVDYLKFKQSLIHWREAIIRELASEGRLDQAGTYTGYIDALFKLYLDKYGMPGKLPSQKEILETLEKEINAAAKDGAQNFFKNLVQFGGAPSAGVPQPIGLFPEAGPINIQPPSSGPAVNPLPAAPANVPAEVPQRPVFVPAAEARPESRKEKKPAAAKKTEKVRSEIRTANFERTPPVYREKGVFVDAAEKNQTPATKAAGTSRYQSDQASNKKNSAAKKKSLKDIRKDIDDQVETRHNHFRENEGFLERGFSSEIDKLYEIFEKLMAGYNQLAERRNLPLFRGKIFIVDSPEVNAFVFAEHDDVYFNTGLVMETARYLQALSRETGREMPLTEELIALTFAHEMGHVFQGTSYEGIDLSSAMEEERSQAAILDLKRQMEYDADRMAMLILDASGYSAKPVLNWLEFLVRITGEGTAQHAMVDHPHPKLRLAEIAQRITSDLTTKNWDQSKKMGENYAEVPPDGQNEEPAAGFHKLDREAYAALKTRHIYYHGHELKTREALEAGAAGAESVRQLLEYSALADERASLTAMKAFADTDKVEDVFAKQVYLQNVINLTARMAREAASEKNPLEIETSKTALTTLLPNNIKAGAHFLEEVFAEEFSNWFRNKEVLSERDRRELESRAEEMTTKFKNVMGKILEAIKKDPQLNIHEKKALVEKILLLLRSVNVKLPEIGKNSFSQGLSSRETLPEFSGVLSDFMSADGQNQQDALEMLARVPFSVFDFYGKTTLDREAALSAKGLGNFKKSIGKGKEEIEDSNLYRKNPAFWPLETPADRQKAWQASLYAWTYESLHQTYYAEEFREERLEQFLDLVEEELEGKDFYQNYEDPEAVRRRVKYFFEIYFTKGWEGLLNAVRSGTQTLDVFTDAALALGISNPKVTTAIDLKMARSHIYSRENGLNPNKLRRNFHTKQAHTPNGAEVPKPQSGLKPRKAFEGNTDLAYDAILADYKQRMEKNLKLEKAAEKLEVFLEVLNDHLKVYAPYFRKLLLNVILTDGDNVLGLNILKRQREIIGRKLYEKNVWKPAKTAEIWFQEKGFQGARDWIAARFSPADTHELMLIFINSVPKSIPINDRLVDVTVLGEDEDFPGFQRSGPKSLEGFNVDDGGSSKSVPMGNLLPLPLEMEQAKAITDYFEKYLFTGRLEDELFFDKALAERYFNVKLAVYQLENPGQSPPPGALFEDLKRLSAHVAFDEVKFALSIKETEKNFHDPLKGYFSVQELNRPELFEKVFSAMLYRPPVNDFEAEYFRQIFSMSREELQRIASDQTRLAKETQKTVGRFTSDTDNVFLGGHGASEASILSRFDDWALGRRQVSFDSLVNTLILRNIIQEESLRNQEGRKPEPLFKIVLKEDLRLAKILSHLTQKSLSRGWLFRVLFWGGSLLIRLFFWFRNFFLKKDFSGFELELADPVKMVQKNYWFRGSGAVRRFLTKLSEGFMTGGETDDFFLELSKSSKFLKAYPLFAGLLTDKLEVIDPNTAASVEPVSYIKHLARQVKAGGVKGLIFRAFARKRKLLDISGGQVPRARVQELGKAMQAPSTTRDGILDIWERKLLPEIHRHSVIGKRLLAKLTRPGWFQSRKKHEKLFDDFLGDALIEVPLEWQNLETQKLDISLKRIPKLLDFYEEAIPLILDPQRQLRYGATAMRLWRRLNPNAGFKKELDAIESFFPKPSQYRDEHLDIFFANHVIPVEETTPGAFGRSIPLTQYAEELYSTYQRLEYDEEWTHGDAIYQVVQSTLSPASREDRREVLLWLMDDRRPLPRLFVAIKEQKNIQFEDLPKHLRYAPLALKREVLGLILTGENGLLNPRTEQDREIKREFAASVFDYFFPPQENDPVRTGIQAEDLDLMREIFIATMENFDQARAALMIQDMLAMQNRLKEMPLGERLAFLLSSFGPVGVKIGQFLSENQQLIPSAYLRDHLASLRDNAKPVRKVAVLRAMEAADFDLKRVRLGKMLGSASMKVVYEGEYLLDDGVTWASVVFKVLRPALDRMVGQDLTVLEKTLNAPKVLGKIKERLPDFNPSEVTSSVKGMIDMERDFYREKINADKIGEAVTAANQVLDVKADVPKVIAVRSGVIIETKARGLEIGKFLTLRSGLKGFFLGKFFSKILEGRGFTGAERRRLSGISPSEAVSISRKHFLQQLFVQGVFHADPHGGNMILGADGLLHIIDPGLIGILNDSAKRTRADLDQTAAARRMMKAVLMGDAATLAQSVSEIVEAEGGNLKTGPGELEIKLQKLFSQNAGELGRFLNQFGALITDQIQGAGKETMSHLIKALSQGLWMFPMTPLQGMRTLKDLRDVLSLTSDEEKVIFQNSVKPYLRNYFNPLRHFKNLKDLTASFLSSILSWFGKQWGKVQLAVSRRRLRLEIKKVTGLFIGKETKGVKVYTVNGGGENKIADFFFDEDFDQPRGPDWSLGKIAAVSSVLKIKSIEESSRESASPWINEAAELYAYYFAFIAHIFVTDPAVSKKFKPIRTDKESFAASKGGAPGGGLARVMSGADKMRGDFFDGKNLPDPSLREKTILANDHPDPSQSNIFHIILAQTLMRRELQKRHGDEAIDFTLHRTGIKRNLEETYTDLYLTSLDVFDEMHGLFHLKDGTPVARRDVLTKRLFKELAPEFIARLHIPPVYKPETRDMIGPRELEISVLLNPHPEGGISPAVIPVVENKIPDFVKNKPLRKFLKKNSEAFKEPGIPFNEKHGDVFVSAVRSLYSYDSKVKTIHLDLYSEKEEINVSMDLTEREYYNYLSKGNLPAEVQVTHYVPESAPARPEIRQTEKRKLLLTQFKRSIADSNIGNVPLNQFYAAAQQLTDNLRELPFFPGREREVIRELQGAALSLEKRVRAIDKTSDPETFRKARNGLISFRKAALARSARILDGLNSRGRSRKEAIQYFRELEKISRERTSGRVQRWVLALQSFMDKPDLFLKENDGGIVMAEKASFFSRLMIRLLMYLIPNKFLKINPGFETRMGYATSIGAVGAVAGSLGPEALRLTYSVLTPEYEKGESITTEEGKRTSRAAVAAHELEHQQFYVELDDRLEEGRIGDIRTAFRFALQSILNEVNSRIAEEIRFGGGNSIDWQAMKDWLNSGTSYNMYYLRVIRVFLYKTEQAEHPEEFRGYKYFNKMSDEIVDAVKVLYENETVQKQLQENQGTFRDVIVEALNQGWGSREFITYAAQGTLPQKINDLLAQRYSRPEIRKTSPKENISRAEIRSAEKETQALAVRTRYSQEFAKELVGELAQNPNAAQATAAVEKRMRAQLEAQIGKELAEQILPQVKTKEAAAMIETVMKLDAAALKKNLSEEVNAAIDAEAVVLRLQGALAARILAAGLVQDVQAAQAAAQQILPEMIRAAKIFLADPEALRAAYQEKFGTVLSQGAHEGIVYDFALFNSPQMFSDFNSKDPYARVIAPKGMPGAPAGAQPYDERHSAKIEIPGTQTLALLSAGANVEGNKNISGVIYTGTAIRAAKLTLKEAAQLTQTLLDIKNAQGLIQGSDEMVINTLNLFLNLLTTTEAGRRAAAKAA